jgi:hypothetical protein
MNDFNIEGITKPCNCPPEWKAETPNAGQEPNREHFAVMRKLEACFDESWSEDEFLAVKAVVFPVLAERDTLAYQLAQAQQSHEHTKQWYGSRFERLKMWARHEIPEQLREQFFAIFAILANGTKDVMEPPPSIQIQLNLTKHQPDSNPLASDAKSE